MAVPITARHPVDFTPPALLARNLDLVKEGKPPILIKVRVPTMYERDAFSAALVRGGVVHYSRSQIRDLMRAGVVSLYPAERFDELRQNLEDLWQLADAINKCELDRSEKFLELMERQAELPPEKHMSDADMEAELQKIQPSIVMDEPTRVKITAIQQDITSRYEPLQKAFADLAEQDVRRNWLCVEIYVGDWEGLQYSPTGNGRGGCTRGEAEYLRMQIGEKAFDEIGGFVFAMHSIDGDEEKNLASLIESSSAAIGSTLAGSMMPTETPAPGSSTGEPSIETPGTGSAPTTESSSSFTKPSKRKTAKSAASPTAAPSSTSP